MQIDLIVAEFVGQPAFLQDSHAVLSREGSAQRQRRLEQFSGCRPDGVRHGIAVEDEVRVEVAIAGVGHCRDPGTVPRLDLGDGFEHLRQRAAWNGDIFDQNGAERDQRRMHGAADREQTLSLGRIGGQFGVSTELRDRRQGRGGFALGGRAVGLHEAVRRAP